MLPTKVFSTFLIASLLGLSLLFGYNAVYAGPYDLERQTTVKVHNVAGNGSGVIVAPRRVLTAAHVADQPDLIVKGAKTKVLKLDKTTDLALMEAEVDCPCITLGNTVDLDDELVAVGYPVNQYVKTQILTSGRAQSRIPNEYRLFTTVPIAGGNSGGGLYKDHKLVGIMVEGVSIGDQMLPISIPINYLSRAVDIDTIKKFLEGTDVTSK